MTGFTQEVKTFKSFIFEFPRLNINAECWRRLTSVQLDRKWFQAKPRFLSVSPQIFWHCQIFFLPTSDPACVSYISQNAVHFITAVDLFCISVFSVTYPVLDVHIKHGQSSKHKGHCVQIITASAGLQTLNSQFQPIFSVLGSVWCHREEMSLILSSQAQPVNRAPRPCLT